MGLPLVLCVLFICASSAAGSTSTIRLYPPQGHRRCLTYNKRYEDAFTPLPLG